VVSGRRFVVAGPEEEMSRDNGFDEIWAEDLDVRPSWSFTPTPNSITYDLDWEPIQACWQPREFTPYLSWRPTHHHLVTSYVLSSIFWQLQICSLQEYFFRNKLSLGTSSTKHWWWELWSQKGVRFENLELSSWHSWWPIWEDGICALRKFCTLSAPTSKADRSECQYWPFFREPHQ